MAHTKKIAAHHALMGVTMVVFGIGATAFGPTLMTNASTEAGSSSQRDAYVLQCKDQYVEKLSSCITSATSQPALRKCLEGYWKEVNSCALRAAKDARTGSGSGMKKEEGKKEKPGSGSILNDEQRRKMEEFKQGRPSPSASPKTESGHSSATSNTNSEQKPPFQFRNTTPRPGEPRPSSTPNNGRDEI